MIGLQTTRPSEQAEHEVLRNQRRLEMWGEQKGTLVDRDETERSSKHVQPWAKHWRVYWKPSLVRTMRFWENSDKSWYDPKQAESQALGRELWRVQCT